MKRALAILAIMILMGAVGDAQKATVEPIWRTHTHWKQYPMPDHWECPFGYDQKISENEILMSANDTGEFGSKSGSQDKSHKPVCIARETPPSLESRIAALEKRVAVLEKLHAPSENLLVPAARPPAQP